MPSSPKQPHPTRAFICPHCDRPALGSICGVAVWDGFNKNGTDIDDLPLEWALLQCAECKDVSVQVREDYGDGFHADTPIIVFPAQRRLSGKVPEPLRREFDVQQ